MSAPLNILSFSTSDIEGGSARSANRIHCRVRALGHTSRMLVGRKSGGDGDVEVVHGPSLAAKAADRLADRIISALALQYEYYPSTHRVLRHPWLAAANIVQLYNTHGGYLSQRIIPHLARRAPIIWRLSDQWMFTGHCAYSGPCERWRSGCGQCPDLETYAPLPFDTTALLWRQKKALYARSDIAVVAPSRWIYNLARQSPLLAGKPLHLIRNGVDRTLFSPTPRVQALAQLGLPPDTRLILFAAHVLDDNPRKGAPLLLEALRRLPPQGREVQVGLAGVGGEKMAAQVALPSHLFGFTHDSARMALIYSAASLLVAPSVVENLPNTVLEAMACGCPVVACDAGGIADAVRHMQTGYLARAEDADDIAAGIAAVTADTELQHRLSANAFNLIEQDFNADREAEGFIGLYRERIAARSVTP
jgi:glycosyltransferase involved in cell wall biosynthesis